MKNVMISIAALGILFFLGCGDSPPTEPTNSAPVISSLSAEPSSLLIDDISVLTCVATDSDGDVLTYTWESNGATLEGNSNTADWIADEGSGTFTITCSVSDGNGGEAVESVELTVNPVDFMGSYTLDALGIICLDQNIIIGTPPDVTGSMTINEDFTYIWSTTVVDDELGTLSNCIGEDISILTYTESGTVSYNGDSITFDNGDGELATFVWYIDEYGLNFEDENTAYLFSEI